MSIYITLKFTLEHSLRRILRYIYFKSDFPHAPTYISNPITNIKLLSCVCSVQYTLYIGHKPVTVVKFIFLDNLTW